MSPYRFLFRLLFFAGCVAVGVAKMMDRCTWVTVYRVHASPMKMVFCR